MNDRLVWIDCEMTGLDLAKDALIEVAVLVTDYELNVLGDGIDLVIAPPPAALEQMGDFVRDMHTASGLLEELEHGIPLAEAEQQVLDFITSYVKEPRKAALAGNSVGTDRTFLVRDMPRVESHLHYRNVDVSSIKELVRRWYPRVYYATPTKTGNHRALADITESIDELRYYRQTVFVPQPGPDSTTARAAASLITGTTPTTSGSAADSPPASAGDSAADSAGDGATEDTPTGA
ncbi:oligoribonuclease [Kribbella sp. NPDC048915]|uniref:oligoribonuclease n=1 Tax=Kribbella sp. NPDC048915 TaxID=3155148 RepID=UPI0033ED0CE9